MRGFEATTRRRFATFATIVVCAFFLSGCGTTKWSDTARTGTEQLLISNAIDSAVGKIDFGPIGDKRVYLKTDAIDGATDNKYLAMALRQHLSASGGVLCDEQDEADYIVEVRAGAVGTDRDEMLLVGIPALTIPSIPGSSTSTGATIPEIPIVKRTKQRGVAKLAVFAYNKHTGRPLWASGNNQSESTARNLWFAGSGPLAKGSIYEKTTFAGHVLPEYMQSNKERKQNSFADHVAVFKENPNDPKLSDPILEETKENARPTAVAAVESLQTPRPLPVPTWPAYTAPYVVPHNPGASAESPPMR